MSEALDGVIKFFNAEKGYGFISFNDGKDIFFHVTRLTDRTVVPESGMHVSFETAEGRTGKLEAVKITILD